MTNDIPNCEGPNPNPAALLFTPPPGKCDTHFHVFGPSDKLPYAVNRKYSPPDSPEIYVHRTGRTGRAGKSGIAISLVSGLDIGNFRYMQTINKIQVAERKIPSEKQILSRTRERLQVKVEHDVRHIPESEQAFIVERLVPVVEEMADSIEGRRDLAAVCAAYLKDHRPETTVREAEVDSPNSCE